jgi:hypothetical protein
LCCVFANADRMSFGEGVAAQVPQLSSAGIQHDGPPEPPCGKPDDRQRENSSNRVPFSSESVSFGDFRRRDPASLEGFWLSHDVWFGVKGGGSAQRPHA